MTKITRRMRQIVKMMRENGAHIQEHRDAFREISTYTVDWKSEDGRYWEIDIKEQTLEKLEKAGLVKLTENNPVYSKGGKNYGKFITSEGVWQLSKELQPEAETMTIFEAMQKTIDEAKKTGNLMRLYKRQSGYFVSREYWDDWLFQAYPGGRKILSTEGKKIVEGSGYGKPR